MESDLNNWLSTQCITTVHIRFVFMECALVSMAMLLRCYAYAKTTITAIQFAIQMLSRWIIFHLLRQRQKRRKLECATLFHVAFSVAFKTQRGAYTSCILTFLAWFAGRNNTSLFLQRRLLCFQQKHLTCLCFTWRENVKNYAKSDLTGQTETDFQECDLNSIPNHIWM